MTTPPSDEQRWLLALCAILTERNKLSHDELGGARRPIGARKCLHVLAQWWDDYTPADVAHTVQFLFDEGQRTAHAADTGESPNALLGWDLARLASVVGSAYGAYLMDRETAWAWLARAAAVVQAAFVTRADFEASYLRGLADWAGADSERFAHAVAARDALYARSDAAVHLPWRLAVADAPPLDDTIPVAECAAGESINAAIERAGNGGRVVIAAGEYREAVRVPFALELVAAEPGRVAIEAPAGGNALAIRVPRSLRAHGLHLRSVRGDDGKTVNAVHVAKGCAHLERCELHGSHHGIGLVGDGDLHLVDCVVRDSGKSGVYIEDGCAVLVRTRVERSGAHGVWRAKGEKRAVLEDVVIDGAGETGASLAGTNIIRRARITGAQTCALLVEGAVEVAHSELHGGAVVVNVNAGGELAMIAGRVGGGASASVQVVGGTARLIGTAIGGPAELGVVAAGASADVTIRDLEVSGHARASLFASDGAHMIGDNCTLRGGRVGAWSRGARVRLSACMIDGAKVTGIQVAGDAPGVFVDCELRAGGGDGVAVEDGSTGARFSRCALAACAGPARWMGAGARALFEDCALDGAGAPDAIAAAEPRAIATTVDGGVLDARALVTEADDHVAVELVGNAALAYFLEARGEVPLSTLGRALVLACQAATPGGDGAVGIGFLLRDGRLVVESNDPGELSRARDALIATLGDGRALRAVVDRAESAELFDGD